jgi:glycosyltransferase involved in cell wall biosynthesis
MPAYNAEKTIAAVLERISGDVWNTVQSLWIVDDGSTDNTALEITRQKEKFNAIKIISFEQNRGYGSAVKAGLKAVCREQVDYAICLHADGQYPPEFILPFIERAEKDRIDILQGSRHAEGTALKGGMPLYKYIAGKFLTAVENSVFRLKLTDYHSGFLCYSRRALTLPFHTFSTSFDFDLEVIACARKHGMRISEIPIPTRYGDEISHLNPITYGFRVLGVLLKYLAGKYNPSDNPGPGREV